MDKPFYLDRLYPFQDQVLKVLSTVETEFYLTGETALSRGILTIAFQMIWIFL